MHEPLNEGKHVMKRLNLSESKRKKNNTFIHIKATFKYLKVWFCLSISAFLLDFLRKKTHQEKLNPKGNRRCYFDIA